MGFQRRRFADRRRLAFRSTFCLLMPLLFFKIPSLLTALALVAMGWASSATAQGTGGIEGRVADPEGRPIRGVAVQLLTPEPELRLLRVVETDEVGYYRIQPLPEGPVLVRVSRVGYAPEEVQAEIPAEGRLRQDFTLRTAAILLQGVDVAGERSRERVRFEEDGGVTLRELTLEEIRLLPGLAEADPIRAVEILPGVMTPTDFSAAFHVRGGSSDQNLVLLDGFPIFNPFHLGGIFSVFNADMVDRVELASGGFPAEFGGRVSSVLRVTSDPGPGIRQVDAGVSLLAARVAVAGGFDPAVRDALGLATARWRVSARRSYVDQLFRPVATVPYVITDLQGVFEGWTRGGSRWTVTSYVGADVLDLGRLRIEDFPLRIYWDWGNRMVGTGWLRPFEGGGSVEARVGATRFSTDLRFPDFEDSQFISQIDQLTMGATLTRPVGIGWTLKAGASADRYTWANQARTGGTSFGDQGGAGWNPALFMQADWRKPGRWVVEAGVRVEGWDGAGADPVVAPTPRVSVKRFVGDGRVALRGSAGRYAQFVQSVRDEEVPLGIDVWVTTSARVPHVISDQVQVGFETAPGGSWRVSGDAFVRNFRGVIAQNPADNPNDELDDLLAGTGRSWGMDGLLEFSGRGIEGSLAVSFLKADRTFPETLSGAETPGNVTYPPIFDRRLDTDLVLRFPLPKGWDGGLRWHVGTGVPYTRPLAGYPAFGPRQSRNGALRWGPEDVGGGIEDGEAEEGPRAVLLGPRNGERYPDYHRLDLSARRTVRRSWGTVTPYVNVLNVYNQKNVLFYFFDFEALPPTRSGLTMFPILPTIGVELRFR